MERNTFLGVLLVTLLALGVALLIPMRQDDNHPGMMPWTIKVNNDGTSTVFGLTLDRSTLGDAQQQFQEPGELTMFRSRHGRLAVEGYFDDVILSGFSSQFVLEARLSDAELNAIYNRGLRVATMSDRQQRITMGPADMARVRTAPIASITYLPRTSIGWATVAKRFGKPSLKMTEPNGTTVHWLYPAKGLDVAIEANGKAVLQYVAPRDFQRVLKPLQAKTAKTQSAEKR